MFTCSLDVLYQVIIFLQYNVSHQYAIIERTSVNLQNNNMLIEVNRFKTTSRRGTFFDAPELNDKNKALLLKYTIYCRAVSNVSR